MKFSTSTTEKMFHFLLAELFFLCHVSFLVYIKLCRLTACFAFNKKCEEAPLQSQCC